MKVERVEEGGFALNVLDEADSFGAYSSLWVNNERDKATIQTGTVLWYLVVFEASLRPTADCAFGEEMSEESGCVPQFI